MEIFVRYAYEKKILFLEIRNDGDVIKLIAKCYVHQTLHLGDVLYYVYNL